MPRDITQDILDAISPYLEEREAAWHAQPDSSRRPTLPSTVEGKVNVRGLIREAGVKPTWEQHCYRKPAVRNIINAVAQGMGLQPIGSRDPKEADHDAVRNVLSRSSSDNKKLTDQLTEALALIDKQRRQIDQLQVQLSIRAETGVLFRVDPIST
jgi:hypothetical protein